MSLIVHLQQHLIVDIACRASLVSREVVRLHYRLTELESLVTHFINSSGDTFISLLYYLWITLFIITITHYY